MADIRVASGITGKLSLDQTSAQTIINGSPLFRGTNGIQFGSTTLSDTGRGTFKFVQDSSTNGYMEIDTPGYNNKAFDIRDGANELFFVGSSGNKTNIRDWLSIGNWSSVESEGVYFNNVLNNATLYTTDVSNSATSSILLHEHSTTQSPTILSAHSNSLYGSHAPVVTDQVLLNITGGGATDNTQNYYQKFASIRYIVGSGTVSPTSAPGALTFNTNSNGSITDTERMRIYSDGHIGTSSTIDASNTTTASVTLAGGLAVNKRIWANNLTVINTISGSISGNAGTVSSGSVTLGTMANIASNRLLGRASAGSGNVESLNASGVLGLLGTVAILYGTGDAPSASGLVDGTLYFKYTV